MPAGTQIKLTRYFSNGPVTQTIPYDTYVQWMQHITMLGISFTAIEVPNA